MGYWSEKMIEDSERAYIKTKNFYVCSSHFEDKDIKNFITQKGYDGHCSFCDNKTQVVAWDDFIEFILPPIEKYYETPDNSLPYDNGFDEEVFDIFYTTELLECAIGLEADFEIIEKISETIENTQWVRCNYFGMEEHEELIYDWKEFSNIVKYKARYVFYKLKGNSYYEGIEKKRDEILEDIGKHIIDLGLIKEFPKKNTLSHNIEIYRARQHKKNEIVKESKDIGAVPNKLAGANRFSPEGISIFYGAADPKTAKLEVINTKQDEILSIGKFKPNKKLNLIDLRDVEKIGMFNLDKINQFGASQFLSNFIESISRKIKDSENERIEYIPSQIVTEYFKFVLPKLANKEIHGIIYNSTQNVGKPCYAIFANSKMCADEGKENENTLLILEKNSISKEAVNYNQVRNYNEEIIPSINSENFKNELIKSINLKNSILVSTLYKKNIKRKDKSITQYVFQKSLFLENFNDFKGINVNKFSGVYIFSEQISASKIKPVYIGISRNLKRRMSDHLIRKQKSSASWADLMDRYKYKTNLMPLFENHPNIANLKVYFLKIDDNFKMHLAEILLVLHYKPHWNSFKTH